MQPFPAADPRSEEVLNAYQQVVMDRLDEGLRAIQQSALQAMHEIAAEMWRTAGAHTRIDRPQRRALPVSVRSHGEHRGHADGDVQLHA